MEISALLTELDELDSKQVSSKKRQREWSAYLQTLIASEEGLQGLIERLATKKGLTKPILRLLLALAEERAESSQADRYLGVVEKIACATSVDISFRWPAVRLLLRLEVVQAYIVLADFLSEMGTQKGEEGLYEVYCSLDKHDFPDEGLQLLLQLWLSDAGRTADWVPPLVEKVANDLMKRKVRLRPETLDSIQDYCQTLDWEDRSPTNMDRLLLVFLFRHAQAVAPILEILRGAYGFLTSERAQSVGWSAETVAARIQEALSSCGKAVVAKPLERLPRRQHLRF